MRTSSVLTTVAIVATVGCGTPKQKEPAAEPPVVTAVTPDSAAKAIADSVAADSAKRLGAKAATGGKTKAGERPLRDSAFGPKYTVDSTGKVVPIKKP